MQRLTSITDQLKTRSCKTVIGVLTAVTRLPEDISIDKQRTLTLVRQWKQIDLNITEAANEAKDNVKYVLERSERVHMLCGSARAKRAYPYARFARMSH